MATIPLSLPACREVTPEFAYTWRPYASAEMIYKTVKRQQAEVVFIIDPWTQRWVISSEPTPALLRLCDGVTRFSEIIRRLNADPALPPPPRGYVAAALELRDLGLIFDSAVEHRSSGLPVYNACEPVGMHLEITNACNMTCTHCYVSSGRPMQNEMTLDEIKRVIDTLPPFSGKRIAISGGEPAVRRDCGEIVAYCALVRGHDVDLYTNGKKFPKELAALILDINQRQLGHVRIQVSLEGATSSTNLQVRGKGSFEETLKSLEMFKELGLSQSVVLFVCVTRHNIHEIDLLIRMAENFDIGMLVFSQWQRQGNAKDTPWQSISPPTAEWVAIGEKLLAYQNPRLKLFGNFFGDLNNNPHGRINLDERLFPKHLYFYNAFPRITPNGDIFADQLWVDPTWALGNIRETSLTQALQSPKFFGQLDEMRHRSEKVDACRACEWRPLCESGSPGHTYAEYGHMNERDLFCDSRIYWFNRYVDREVDRSLGLSCE